jgi:uncharacterized membrane protein YgcG
MAKNFNVSGGLGFQGYNTKNYMKSATARTGTDTTAATRDEFYGGASTPKTPAAKPGMISLPGTAMKMLGQKFSTKYTPGSYATYRKGLAAKKPVAVVKPAAKKLATVVSNVTNEKLSPAKKAMARAKPPATRFGVVTGKTTGTRVSGGGGYGGGGTRGGGSLSGGGSGTRSAGTSRTGGTQRNDPVRG